jgi:hypothetical protein
VASGAYSGVWLPRDSEERSGRAPGARHQAAGASEIGGGVDPPVAGVRPNTLCGHGRDRPQLMRKSLGRHT